MTLPTFSPIVAPSPGTRVAPKLSLLEAEFGDGYTQSAPNGLNHRKETMTLRWDGLTEAQFIALRDFFRERGGYKSFYYQPRGEAQPMKWRCKDWSGADRSPWSFEAKLEQSFTLEV